MPTRIKLKKRNNLNSFRPSSSSSSSSSSNKYQPYQREKPTVTFDYVTGTSPLYARMLNYEKELLKKLNKVNEPDEYFTSLDPKDGDLFRRISGFSQLITDKIKGTPGVFLESADVYQKTLDDELKEISALLWESKPNTNALAKTKDETIDIHNRNNKTKASKVSLENPRLMEKYAEVSRLANQIALVMYIQSSNMRERRKILGQTQKDIDADTFDNIVITNLTTEKNSTKVPVANSITPTQMVNLQNEGQKILISPAIVGKIIIKTLRRETASWSRVSELETKLNALKYLIGYKFDEHGNLADITNKTALDLLRKVEKEADELKVKEYENSIPKTGREDIEKQIEAFRSEITQATNDCGDFSDLTILKQTDTKLDDLYKKHISINALLDSYIKENPDNVDDLSASLDYAVDAIEALENNVNNAIAALSRLKNEIERIDNSVTIIENAIKPIKNNPNATTAELTTAIADASSQLQTAKDARNAILKEGALTPLTSAYIKKRADFIALNTHIDRVQMMIDSLQQKQTARATAESLLAREIQRIDALVTDIETKIIAPLNSTLSTATTAEQLTTAIANANTQLKTAKDAREAILKPGAYNPLTLDDIQNRNDFRGLNNHIEKVESAINELSSFNLFKQEIASIDAEVNNIPNGLPSLGNESFDEDMKTISAAIELLSQRSNDVLSRMITANDEKPTNLEKYKILQALHTDLNNNIEKKKKLIEQWPNVNDLHMRIADLKAEMVNSDTWLNNRYLHTTTPNEFENLLNKYRADNIGYEKSITYLQNAVNGIDTKNDSSNKLVQAQSELQNQINALRIQQKSFLDRIRIIELINEIKKDTAAIIATPNADGVNEFHDLQLLTNIAAKNYQQQINNLLNIVGNDPALESVKNDLNAANIALDQKSDEAKTNYFQPKITKLLDGMDADIAAIDNYIKKAKSDPKILDDKTLLNGINSKITNYETRINKLMKTLVETPLNNSLASHVNVTKTAGTLMPRLDELRNKLNQGLKITAPTPPAPIATARSNLPHLASLDLNRVSAHAGVASNSANAEVSKFNALCNYIEHAQSKGKAASELFEAARNMLYTMDNPSLKDWMKAMSVYGDTLSKTLKVLSPPTSTSTAKKSEIEKWDLLNKYVKMNENINKIVNGNLKLDFSFMDYTAIVDKNTNIADHLMQNVFDNPDLASAPIGMHASGGLTRHEMLLEGKKDISVKYLTPTDRSKTYTRTDLAVCIVTELKNNRVEQTVTVPEMLNPFSILTNAAQQFLLDNPIKNVSLKTLKSDIEDLIKNMMLRFEETNIPYTAQNFQKYISSNLPKGMEETKGKDLAKTLESAYKSAMDEKTLLEIAALRVAKYMQSRGFSIGEWAGKPLDITNMSMGPAAAQAMADFAAYHKIDLLIHSPRAYRGIVGDPKKIEALIQKDPDYLKLMKPKGQLAEATSAAAIAATSSPVSTPSVSPLSASALSLSPASPSSSPLLSLSTDSSSTRPSRQPISRSDSQQKFNHPIKTTTHDIDRNKEPEPDSHQSSKSTSPHTTKGLRRS